MVWADVTLLAVHMPLGAAVPPVELVGNLEGFPQIHRPVVVLPPALR